VVFAKHPEKDAADTCDSKDRQAKSLTYSFIPMIGRLRG
jgi:hypothetical protein